MAAMAVASGAYQKQESIFYKFDLEAALTELGALGILI
jgi:hypothetical protein